MVEKVEKNKWLVLRICPRCGKRFNYINVVRRGDHEYKYCVHVQGYVTDPLTGKRKRKVKKCYVGATEYEYVSKLHELEGLTFRGALEDGRLGKYLRDVLEYVLNPRRVALVELGYASLSTNGWVVDSQGARYLLELLEKAVEKMKKEIPVYEAMAKEAIQRRLEVEDQVKHAEEREAFHQVFIQEQLEEAERGEADG